MKQKWTAIAVIILGVALIGLWFEGKKSPVCETCTRKQTAFFQIFSAPTADFEARQKKFLGFAEQSYPYFRVAITPEEAAYPDVQAWIEKKPHQFVTLPAGFAKQELFYRWVHSIPSGDIVVCFSEAEALDLKALERLKALYDGSAAWLAFQGDIRHWARQGILSGYASLFQKIKLQDFLEQGHFSESSLPENRLFELAGRHVRRLRGEFIQGKEYGYAWISRSRKPYPRYRPTLEEVSPQTDLVVFSSDSPLKLYAFLESIQSMRSLQQVSVIYQASSEDYNHGYERVKKQFNQPLYLKQGQDFKPLVLEATFQSPSPYVIFATDDWVVQHSLDPEMGIAYMEKTGATGLFYALGNRAAPLPPTIPLEPQVRAWQFSGGEGEWRHPDPLQVSLYRKSDIKNLLTTLKYRDLSTLQKGWTLKGKAGAVGLFYEAARTMPLSLKESKEELLAMFLQGLKFDIKALERYSPSSNTQLSFTRQNEMDP